MAYGEAVNVFEDQTEGSWDHQLACAGKALLCRISELGLVRGEFSTVELRLDESDLRFLEAWFRRTTESQLRRAICDFEVIVGLPRAAAPLQIAGALLLIYGAECIRRKGREGEAWPTLRDALPEHLDALFPGGNPHSLLRDAVAFGARWLGVRNVLGEVGLNDYLDTFYLQIGFTRNGLRRLPEWLCNYSQTQAITRLLSSSSGSASFRQLWTALREYRANRRSETDLRSILRISPWVLPNWHDDLVAASKQKPHLSGRTDEEGEADLLKPIRLRWFAGEGPTVEARLGDDFVAGLEPGEYSVKLVGEQVAKLLVDDEGARLFPANALSSIPLRSSNIEISITSELDEVIRTEVATVHDPDDIVTIFDGTTGLIVNDASPAAMSTQRDYVFVFASDTSLNPPPFEVRRVSAKLHAAHIRSGWSSIQALLDDEVMWDSTARASRSETTSEVSVSLVQPAGPQHRIDIYFPDQFELIWVSVDRKRVGVDQASLLGNRSCVRTEGFSLANAARNVAKVCLRLRDANGSSFTVTKSVVVPESRALYLDHHGDWKRAEGGRTVQELIDRPWALWLPGEDEMQGSRQSNFAIVLGDVLIDRPRTKPGPIRSVPFEAYGQGLNIVPGPYNASSVTLRVATSVRNEGLVEQGQFYDGRLYLKTRYGREPRQSDTVWVLDLEGGWSQLQPQLRKSRSGPVWVCDDVGTSCAAAVIGSDGICAGTWLNETQWLEAFEKGIDRDAGDAAAMARWAKLPLASPSVLGKVTDSVSRNTRSVLQAWLLDEHLPSTLGLPPSDSIWHSTVRSVLWGVPMSTSESRGLLGDVFHYATGIHPSAQDPGSVMRIAAPQFLITDPFIGFAAVGALRNELLPMKEQLIDQVLGTSHGRNRPQRIRELTQEVGSAALRYATDDGARAAFVRTGLLDKVDQLLAGQKVAPIHSFNVRLALGLEGFRRLVAIRVLERTLQ